MAHLATTVPVAPVPANARVMRIAGIASLAPVLSLPELAMHCGACRTRELCLPGGLTGDETKEVDALTSQRITIRKNDTLYRAGAVFHALYAIKLGSLKTAVLAEDGREQVTGYHMLGDMVGLDGIGTGHHGATAIALEDSEICVLPFAGVENLARTLPSLQHNLHQLMSRAITHYQGVMLTLGSMRADERLAVFLLDLADRYRQRGYSSTEYVLRMSRGDIGSYLGLTLETVSRLFSQFHAEALIEVHGRSVKLLDPGRLRRIVAAKQQR